MEIPKGYCQCGCGGRTTIAKNTDSRYGHIKGQPKRYIKGHHPVDRSIPLVERFWPKVDKNGPMHPTLHSRCWLWMAFRTPAGYGQMNINHTSKPATHVSWFLTQGVWPTHQMNHKCDNPPCVNPAHLFDGTDQDNKDDMVQKGRNAKGEKVGTSKLTAKEIITIRRLSRSGVSGKVLAKRFGVVKSAISLITRRKRWKHFRRA